MLPKSTDQSLTGNSHSLVQRLLDGTAEAFNGAIEGFCGFNNVVGPPEVRLGEEFHIVVEALAAVVTVTATDLLGFGKDIGYHELTDDAVCGSKEPTVPVTLETHLIADVVEVGDAVFGTIVDVESEFHRGEPQSLGSVDKHCIGGTDTVPHIQMQVGPGDSQRLLVDIQGGIEKGVGFRGDYGEEDLEPAKHPNEIQRGRFVNLNIDLNVHGVGGIDTWGARTLPQYTIDGNKPYHYSFFLEIIQ